MAMSSVPFRPAWWLPGPHAQTVGGRFLRSLDHGPLLTDRVELPDGDFVDLHETPNELPEDAPRVVVLHGLEGSSRANYIATLARELSALGIRAVRMNFRACGGEMNRLPRFYHAGDTGDLASVIEHLRNRLPDSPLAAVGFSLGGNILLKYLGERGAERPTGLVAAAAVSVPFDLSAGTGRLEQPGMARVYTRYFIRKLRAKTRRKRALLETACDVERALAARTVREYDEALTARLHGFRDAWHYYDSSSSIHWLERIRVPTLLLHSLDDPFLPETSVPLEVIHGTAGLSIASPGKVGTSASSPALPGDPFSGPSAKPPVSSPPDSRNLRHPRMPTTRPASDTTGSGQINWHLKLSPTDDRYR